MKDKYLRETRMIDFSNPAIQKLIQNMKWQEMGEFERIKAIYNYVRDDILFGYNIDDGIPASKVLADGYGVAVKDFRNIIIEFDRNNT